jgi:hypothetical protein
MLDRFGHHVYPLFSGKTKMFWRGIIYTDYKKIKESGCPVYYV